METIFLHKELESINDFEKYKEKMKAHLVDDMALSDHLHDLLDSKGLDKKNVKADALRFMSKSYFNQIFNEKKTKDISRNFILVLAFALKLNREEADKVLKLADVATLSPRKIRDSLIIIALNNGMSLLEADDMLASEDLITIAKYN